MGYTPCVRLPPLPNMGLSASGARKAQIQNPSYLVEFLRLNLSGPLFSYLCDGLVVTPGICRVPAPQG